MGGVDLVASVDITRAEEGLFTSCDELRLMGRGMRSQDLSKRSEKRISESESSHAGSKMSWLRLPCFHPDSTCRLVGEKHAQEAHEDRQSSS